MPTMERNAEYAVLDLNSVFKNGGRTVGVYKVDWISMGVDIEIQYSGWRSPGIGAARAEC